MKETIRDYIKRRVRLYVGAAIVGWLIVALAVVPLSLDLWRGPAPARLAALGIVVFMGAMIAIQLSVRCPKCTGKIGQNIALPVGIGLGSGPTINFCPYCGVSLDESRLDAGSLTFRKAAVDLGDDKQSDLFGGASKKKRDKTR